MKAALAVVALFLCTLASAQFYGDYKDVRPAGVDRVGTKDAGTGVRVDQRLNEFVPLDARFLDEDGRPVELRRYFVDKPVVLLPIFYRCPGVCETELFNLTDSLKGFKRDFIGREFNVVVLDIDPHEGPNLAAQKKDTAIAAYMGANTDRLRRLTAEEGWHFLTGELKEIRRVTDALGFKYTYDERSGNIAHPAGLMILTPAGKISRYFVTDEYPQQVLLSSIRDAAKSLVGSRDDRPFFLACVQMDPLTGQYTLNILNTLKTLGVLTLISILVSMVVWNRKYKATHGGAF